MQTIVATEADRARFDAFVASTTGGDALQSWAWGEVKRPSGWIPVRLMVTDGDTIRAVCQMLRLTPMRGVPPIVYAPRGPVFAPGDVEAVRELLAAIRTSAGKAYLFTCDPPLDLEAAAPLLEAGLRPVTSGGFGGVQPRAVMTLDLSAGADAVFAGFHSKWRYNCRLAERRGVSVREGGREDLKTFYDILVETAARDEFLVRGLSYYETIFDELSAHGMVRLLLADLEGDTIAGILLFSFGDRVTYTYGASADRHRGVMPNHLLQWTAIRDAANAGFRVYDFRGVSPEVDGVPTQDHLAGLNRFKTGFGAQYEEYLGTLDMPLRPVWYLAWKKFAPRILAWRHKRAGSEGAD